MMKFLSGIVFHILIFCFIGPVFLSAQEITPPDSSSHSRALSDSSRAKIRKERNKPESSFQSAATDTTIKGDIKIANSGLDSAVVYSARSVVNEIEDNITYLIGEATVKYKKMIIKAGKITVLWKKNTIVAESMPDTTSNPDIEDNDSRDVKNSGRPEFSDGKEEMVGDKMEFNFKSERGRIIRGRTKLQGGYYLGETVKLMDPKVIFVRDGNYSTCENEEPHFHFNGKKMKIITGERIIAKPVVFYIGKIPLAILPFAYFPTEETGRQSGIIIPRYGSSQREGRALEDMGYYWATNDYFDARLTMSFFEKTGVLFKTHMNYKLRYKFNGSVSGSYTRKNIDGTGQRRWDLRINHSQEIDPNTRFSVSGTFVNSNSFYQDYSSNRSQRLSRQLNSNATFTKRWGEGKNSLTLNLSQQKDLETGRETLRLPRLQLNRTTTSIIPFNKDKTGRSKAEPKWFNQIKYSYRADFVNTVQKDSTGDPDANIDRRAQHDISLNFTNPKKLLGWLSLSQNVKYDEDWFDRTQTFTWNDSTKRTESSEKKGFAARRQFNYSASASTNLYGTFNPKIGPVRAIRHKMSPSLSFTYRPDFSSSSWGYFQTIRDDSGKVVDKKDRFGSGTSRGKQNNLGYRMSNLFQMKLGEGDKEKKVNLFNLNFGGSYNLAADSLKWSNLSTTFQASPKKNLNVSMNMSHSFYKYDIEANRPVNKLLFNERGIFKFLRLTRFSVNARWTLSGSQKSKQKDKEGQSASSTSGNQTEPPNQTGQQQSSLNNEPEDRFAPENPFSATGIPWRASLAFSLSINKPTPVRTTRTAYIDLSNVEVQLTKNWRISYRLRYDIERRKIADQQISFYRDLHCWEARFSWNPSGTGSGSFYFIINIKAPHLRSIKIEHRGGTTSFGRPF